MKNTILIITFIFSAIFTTNAQEQTFNLTINISGLNSDKGNLMVGVYNKKDNFLKKQFKGDLVKIKDKKSVVVFKDLPKGEYAVSFVHDENNNKKMDTNFFGIPKEDYGCSNNATGFMGPPKYNDAKFLLSENKTINIKI
tara:strand:- start:7246 stop:7665 length:420 start_codon:yes stop_codon:yes gene_type:complete